MPARIDVSVVVPCYNVEKYLDQALTSAEANNRASIEILVVNDGSTDGSLTIAQAHAARDSRVRVIDKQNEGYGASMNRGISEAFGTYIAILEPDDYLEPHMYDDLFEFAMGFGLDTPPDIVKTPYWRIWMPETPRERKLHCSYYHRIEPAAQPFTLADEPRLVYHHPSIWSAIYRREFLAEKGIRFKEVPGAGWVDNPFLFETMCQAETIVYLDSPYYCYREDLPGSSSATRVLELSLERWNDMADVVDRLGIDDFGIRASLAVIAFRYAGEIVARGGLENENLRTGMAEMFSRIDRTTILALTNVSPQLRTLAFELSGRSAPKFDSLEYYKALVKEFFYSTSTNGIGFALARVGVYLDRRRNQDKRAGAMG